MASASDSRSSLAIESREENQSLKGQSSPHTHDHNHSHHSLIPSGATASLASTEEGGLHEQLYELYPVPPAMDYDEASYLIRTILAFKMYAKHTYSRNHTRMRQFYSLSQKHRTLLQPNFIKKLEGIDEAIEVNGVLAKRLSKVGEDMYLGGQAVTMNGPIVPLEKYERNSYNS
jgi:hypothetical protein